ncbi:MAG: glutathione S-transferase C-terminal domain-containing protein [Alphaproteobacteria bacterium]
MTVLGRHSAQEVARPAERAIDAIAATLGDKPHLMGARACGASATVFAVLLGRLNRTFETPIRPAVEQRSNLAAYCDRMLRQYYREFAETKTVAA